MTARIKGGAMATARYVRVHCGACGKEVYAVPLHMTLILDIVGKGARYTFYCERCGERNQEAHNWFAMQLLAAGVPISDPADVLAAAMCDDDDIATEIEAWADGR